MWSLSYSPNCGSNTSPKITKAPGRMKDALHPAHLGAPLFLDASHAQRLPFFDGPFAQAYRYGRSSSLA